MLNKQAAALSLLFVSGLIIFGCAPGDGSSSGEEADPTARPPEGEPDLVGAVSGVEGLDDSSSPTRVLIQQHANSPDESSAGATSGGSKNGASGTVAKGKQPRLYLNVTDQTLILQHDQGGNGGSLARAEAAELEKGQEVRVWHGQVVSRSYPGQAQADAIVIDRGSE